MKRRTNMKSPHHNLNLSSLLCAAGAISLLCMLVLGSSPQTATKAPEPATKTDETKKAAAPAPVFGKAFRTPDEAADAIIDAAEKYDVKALDEILGPDGKNIVHTGEPAREKETAAAFAARARE